jgi:hypothetical protein
MTRSSPLLLLLPLLFGLGCLGGCKAAKAPPGQAQAAETPRGPVHRPRRIAFFDRPAALAAARRSGTQVPLLVMRGTNRWAMVIGADSPDFALYGDGRVIYRAGNGFSTAVLSRTQVRALWRDVHPSELAPLAGRFMAAAMTDQPDTDLLVYGVRPFAISVYGSLDAAEERSRLPAAVVRAADRLRAFRAPGARPWLPERIEVMIWPYEYAPDRSVRWPSSWPDWRSPGAVQRGDSYSLALPSSQLDRVRALLARRTEKAAVEIGGRKWAVDYRFPFPHEELWMPPARR